MNEIRFYKTNGPYGFFSNFSSHPIFISEAVWPTVEHYFQAEKFDNLELKIKIKSLDSPMEAANVGRDKKNKIRIDWEEVKEKIMLNALVAKFLQHPVLRSKLLKTGTATIIEDTKNDSYWGNGGDGSGKNRLGKLIMEVREKIKSYSENPDVVLPPWIAFPSVSQYDIFWRMGLGEEYLTEWSKYYLSNDKKNYRNRFPEVAEWEGIYD